LLDILNSIGQSAPAGRPPQGQPQSQQHMSKLAIAMIGLLAYKVLTRPGGITGRAGQPQPQPQGQGKSAPGSALGGDAGGLGGLGDLLGRALGPQAGGTTGGAAGGNLSDILKGGLGGILGGAAAGSVLTGGLNDILKQLQDAGHGDVAKSWVGTGENKDIDPDDLGHALGADKINALSAQSGLSRDDLLEGLSQQLPQLIDRLTPQGRVPTSDEAARMI